jgi:hypothetical protein
MEEIKEDELPLEMKEWAKYHFERERKRLTRKDKTK